jgi:hypothetical protein
MEKSKRIIVEKKVMVCLKMWPDLKRRMKTHVAAHSLTITDWLNDVIEKNLK